MKKINILRSGILILYSFILINCSKKQESPSPPPIPFKVVSIDSNQIIFHYLKWFCPWDCRIELKTIYQYISSNIPIQVFLKKASDANWIPVPSINQIVNNNSFSYEINANSWLVVYTETVKDNDVLYEVKIVY